MSRENVFISAAETAKQIEYAHLAQSLLELRFGTNPKAYVHTYGCQGNVSDSERIKGLLRTMGFSFCSSAEEADLVLFNTCAVREHAEARVFGNVGALKPIKTKKRDMLILLCGCMMQQPHIAQKIKMSYPIVDIVFGTFAVHRLPELVYRRLQGSKRIFEIGGEGNIAEGLPVYRDRSFKAWLPIMYGCDNFCSYCVVPYVRGRERSRHHKDIQAEARQLIADGALDITLLGQNVNSYGKGLDTGLDFSDLLRLINDTEGEFLLRFMTSHPKDCSKRLLDTMADCSKVAHHLHLPFQSGNNRILSEMNRRYTVEKYMELIDYARLVMPDISITSDVIVGFPGETDAEFRDTLELIKRVEFTSLFTFIYSPREGTKAALMPDPVSREEKTARLQELCELQEKIAAERTASYKGKSFRVLVEESEGNGVLVGRTDGNVNIRFKADESLIGTYQTLTVTDALSWVITGELDK